MPVELLITKSGLWYGKLGHQTTADELAEKCEWSEDLEDELTGLTQRLVETNPKGKSQQLRTLRDRLVHFHGELTQWGERLSNLSCENYFVASRDSNSKRKAAEADAESVFANAPLAGIGSETWKLLWEQARAYSEQIAYKSIPFPNTAPDARCVLCQQHLDVDARNRLLSFESFVRGGLETQANAAERRLTELYANLGEPGSVETINLRMDSVGVTVDAERSAIVSYYMSLEKRRTALLVTQDSSQLPSRPSDDDLRFLRDRADELEQMAVSLDEDATGENRPTMENRRTELVARKWLSQQRTSVYLEVERLKEVHRLEKAQKLTSTQALSAEKSILAEELITAAYIERFQQELDRLGARRVKVSLVKTRAERGHVFHAIRLQDLTTSVHAAEVLSEGEFRIVSLAAFLADVEVRGGGCPFIFDDPISSLDHVFEESTARRLVQLSKSRQVIVFTHRLSLVEYIEDAAKKDSIDLGAIISLRSERWGIGEPGLPSMNQMKPEGALNQLSTRLGQARQTLDHDGRLKYEDLAKGICGDFRIMLELVIEKKLVGGVVRRHSREIHTKGILMDLAKISLNDCTFFDDLMTKYSRYEHSQSGETPLSLPEPDEIGADIQNVKDWMTGFKARPIA